IDDLDCAPADPSTRLDTDADGDGAPACGLKCGDGSCSVACEGNLCPVGCPEGHEYCPPPCTNVLSCALDCDDQDALVKAGSKEECNGRDDNCDGAIDEGFLDSDRDGQKDCVDDNDDNDCALDLPDNCDTTPNCESYQAILDRGGKPQCKNPCDIGEWPGFDDVMMCAMERTIKNDPRCRYDGCPWELLGMEGEWFSSRPDLGNAQFASFSSFSTPSFSACSALSNQTANIGNVVSDIRKNCLARERSSPAYAECLRDSDGNGVGDVCQ
ncbi:MAG TPA: putative metal-binding motif-containing protein, partial [Polyangiaceae bacterium]|nr:putative metal-binding motif-containing protein [Polyangiaceae bacterium]